MTRHRHELRRRRVLLVSVVVLVFAGLLGAALITAISAVRRDLVLGRAAAERGRERILAGDAEAAAAAFRDSRQRFADAAERADGMAFRIVGWLPIAGRTSDAVQAITRSAVDASDAMVLMADAFAAVPGGPAGLAPTRGAVPVERFPPLARAATEADALMTDALARLETAPDSLLLGPVGPARRDAEQELGVLSDTVHTASVLLHGLPTFLGAEEPRRYFLGAQNPAELRGTGGLIGAYSILEIEEGRFQLSPFVPIHSLPVPRRTVQPPNDDYAEYDYFRRHGLFWTAINVMPDFPSVAQAILSSYEAGGGEALDGLILADPFALSALLEATGPVELEGYDVTIDADNVVPFTTNEAYSVVSDPALRKRVLGDVARAALGRFFEQPTADQRDVEKLLEAAAGRHITVYSRDPSMQDGLRATPVGGTLRPPGSDDDLLSVVVNSGAGSKVDFFQERELSYAVDLQLDGTASATFDLTLRNRAPTSGEPRYVIGPFRQEKAYFGRILQRLHSGESVALVNVYCGSDCIPREARLEGRAVDVGVGVDLGVRYVQEYYSVRSGEQKRLRLSWDDPAAWEGNGSGGVYRMTFSNQVTVRPASLTIRIQPPQGMQVVSATPPLDVENGVAVYRGTPGARLDLAVEFRPPLPVRLWRNVMRFLTAPAFEI